ncbi:hypothetical protein ACROYT_G031005 [Oculina patagonica]
MGTLCGGCHVSLVHCVVVHCVVGALYGKRRGCVQVCSTKSSYFKVPSCGIKIQDVNCHRLILISGLDLCNSTAGCEFSYITSVFCRCREGVKY